MCVCVVECKSRAAYEVRKPSRFVAFYLRPESMVRSHRKNFLTFKYISLPLALELCLLGSPATHSQLTALTHFVADMCLCCWYTAYATLVAGYISLFCVVVSFYFSFTRFLNLSKRILVGFFRVRSADMAWHTKSWGKSRREEWARENERKICKNRFSDVGYRLHGYKFFNLLAHFFAVQNTNLKWIARPADGGMRRCAFAFKMQRNGSHISTM